jgi:hypothetical protein
MRRHRCDARKQRERNSRQHRLEIVHGFSPVILGLAYRSPRHRDGSGPPIFDRRVSSLSGVAFRILAGIFPIWPAAGRFHDAKPIQAAYRSASTDWSSAR